MKNKADVLKQYKADRKAAKSGLERQYRNTRECHEFYSGDFMSYRDRIRAPNSGKTVMVQFNKVKPYINAVAGFMAQHRRKPSYLARVMNDTAMKLFSQYANALSDFCRDEMNADQEETAQDKEMLIAGYGATDTALSWEDGRVTTEPHGQVVYDVLDGEKVWWDPTARKKNLLDRRFCGYDKEMDLDEAMALFDAEEGDFEDVADPITGDDFKFNPRGGDFSAIREVVQQGWSLDWTNGKKTEVKLSFYQWYDIESYWRADNPLASIQNPQIAAIVKMKLDMIGAEGADDDAVEDDFVFDSNDEILVCNAEQKEALEEFFGDSIELFEAKRKVFYGAIISGEKVFRIYQLQSQSGFSIKFKTGDYDKKNKMWVGMVNSMKDPILYYNKALTELMYVIGANSKGGVLYEEDAVEDIKKFEAGYYKTNAIIKVRKGAISGQKIKDKRTAFAPTGYEQIIALADGALTKTSGIPDSFFGETSDNESGILYKRRIRQAMTVIALYMDSVTLYQKEHGRMMLDLMRELVENSPGAMFFTLTGGGKPQFLTMAQNKLVDEYSIMIQEAPDSVDEKQEKAQTLMQMGDKLIQSDPQSARQFYALAVRYLGLESDEEQEILSILVPQQGAKVDAAVVQKLMGALQKATGQAAQMEMADKQSQIQERQSKIALNAAKIKESGATTHEKAATTVWTLAESDKVQVETALAARGGARTHVDVDV